MWFRSVLRLNQKVQKKRAKSGHCSCVIMYHPKITILKYSEYPSISCLNLIMSIDILRILRMFMASMAELHSLSGKSMALAWLKASRRSSWASNECQFHSYKSYEWLIMSIVSIWFMHISCSHIFTISKKTHIYIYIYKDMMRGIQKLSQIIH